MSVCLNEPGSNNEIAGNQGRCHLQCSGRRALVTLKLWAV